MDSITSAVFSNLLWLVPLAILYCAFRIENIFQEVRSIRRMMAYDRDPNHKD